MPRLWVVLLLLVLATLTSAKSCKWPSDKYLGDDLPKALEISGVAWSPKLEVLAAVGDEDALAVLETNGKVVNIFRNPDRGFGLESITFGPLAAQLLGKVYTGIEFPPAVAELDLNTGAALRLWNISNFPGDEKYGMEALAFIPINDTTGWFFAGSQLTGLIYVVGPFSDDGTEKRKEATVSMETGLFMSIVGSFDPGLSLNDLAALSYDSTRSDLWALFDRYNVAATLKNSTAITIDPSSAVNWQADCQYEDVPGDGQEGICVAGKDGKYLILGQDIKDSTKKQLVRWDYDDTMTDN